MKSQRAYGMQVKPPWLVQLYRFREGEAQGGLTHPIQAVCCEAHSLHPPPLKPGTTSQATTITSTGDRFSPARAHPPQGLEPGPGAPGRGWGAQTRGQAKLRCRIVHLHHPELGR